MNSAQDGESQLGAVVEADIAKLSAQDLMSWVAAHGVVHFTQQKLNVEQFADVARLLGTIRKFDQLPALPGTDLSIVDHAAGTAIGERFWHSDLSWMPSPPAFTLLRFQEVPERGGLLFARLATSSAVIGELSRSVAKDLRQMQVIHRRRPNPQAEFTLHPLVTRQRGEQIEVFLSPLYGKEVAGLDLNTSDYVLATLLDHITGQRQFYADVRRGDVLIWSNRAVLHQGSTQYDPAAARRMYRATVFSMIDETSR